MSQNLLRHVEGVIEADVPGGGPDVHFEGAVHATPAVGFRGRRGRRAGSRCRLDGAAAFPNPVDAINVPSDVERVALAARSLAVLAIRVTAEAFLLPLPTEEVEALAFAGAEVVVADTLQDNEVPVLHLILEASHVMSNVFFLLRVDAVRSGAEVLDVAAAATRARAVLAVAVATETLKLPLPTEELVALALLRAVVVVAETFDDAEVPVMAMICEAADVVLDSRRVMTHQSAAVTLMPFLECQSAGATEIGLASGALVRKLDLYNLARRLFKRLRSSVWRCVPSNALRASVATPAIARPHLAIRIPCALPPDRDVFVAQLEGNVLARAGGQLRRLLKASKHRFWVPRILGELHIQLDHLMAGGAPHVRDPHLHPDREFQATAANRFQLPIILEGGVAEAMPKGIRDGESNQVAPSDEHSLLQVACLIQTNRLTIRLLIRECDSQPAGGIDAAKKNVCNGVASLLPEQELAQDSLGTSTPVGGQNRPCAHGDHDQRNLAACILHFLGETDEEIVLIQLEACPVFVLARGHAAAGDRHVNARLLEHFHGVLR
eukprot:CAMPEP_0183485186 /NCGR_PEP_ID=MMETSP0370-20130417/179301_1 /TAXON_ID=268820 /ORGANISM="Peridinium aciculiferum, Strain PAER-2" /LENGTH=550 /DNA_ID=CAMNT_0025678483 /DNA_START=499 /DNA_END=2151 /DNA_ORIENTATION=+